MVILVEGESDAAALRAAARVLDVAQPQVTAMNGITNLRHFLTTINGDAAGLYDVGEAHHVAQALGAGVEGAAGPSLVEARGFFGCDPDLEAELIAALGAGEVLAVIEQQGRDAHRFRQLQQMPHWHGRPVEDQLRRWLGSGGSRKVRYAELLAASLSPDRVPRPLRRVLEYAAASGP